GGEVPDGRGRGEPRARLHLEVIAEGGERLGHRLDDEAVLAVVLGRAEQALGRGAVLRGVGRARRRARHRVADHGAATAAEEGLRGGAAEQQAVGAGPSAGVSASPGWRWPGIPEAGVVRSTRRGTQSRAGTPPSKGSAPTATAPSSSAPRSSAAAASAARAPCSGPGGTTPSRE